MIGEFVKIDKHPKAEMTSDHKNGLTRLDPESVGKALSELDPADPLFFNKTTRIVAAGTVHYWPQGTEIDERIVFSWRENWIIAAVSRLEITAFKAGLLDKLRFARLERTNFQDILEKGVGFCSQAALALKEYLHEVEVEAEVVGLDGHVVLEVEVEGRSVILDPDYNIVLPFSSSTAENEPIEVSGMYREAGYPDDIASSLAEIYGSGGNVAVYAPEARFIVALAGVFKFLIPAIFLSVGGHLFLPDVFRKRVIGSAR